MIKILDRKIGKPKGNITNEMEKNLEESYLIFYALINTFYYIQWLKN